MSLGATYTINNTTSPIGITFTFGQPITHATTPLLSDDDFNAVFDLLVNRGVLDSTAQVTKIPSEFEFKNPPF